MSSFRGRIRCHPERISNFATGMNPKSAMPNLQRVPWQRCRRGPGIDLPQRAKFTAMTGAEKPLANRINQATEVRALETEGSEPVPLANNGDPLAGEGDGSFGRDILHGCDNAPVGGGKSSTRQPDIKENGAERTQSRSDQAVKRDFFQPGSATNRLFRWHRYPL